MAIFKNKQGPTGIFKFLQFNLYMIMIHSTITPFACFIDTSYFFFIAINFLLLFILKPFNTSKAAYYDEKNQKNKTSSAGVVAFVSKEQLGSQRLVLFNYYLSLIVALGATFFALKASNILIKIDILVGNSTNIIQLLTLLVEIILFILCWRWNTKYKQYPLYHFIQALSLVVSNSFVLIAYYYEFQLNIATTIIINLIANLLVSLFFESIPFFIGKIPSCGLRYIVRIKIKLNNFGIFLVISKKKIHTLLYDGLLSFFAYYGLASSKFYAILQARYLQVSNANSNFNYKVVLLTDLYAYLFINHLLFYYFIFALSDVNSNNALVNYLLNIPAFYAIVIMLWIFLALKFLCSAFNYNKERKEFKIAFLATEFFVVYLRLLSPLIDIFSQSYKINSKKYNSVLKRLLATIKYPVPLVLFTEDNVFGINYPNFMFLIPSPKENYFKLGALIAAILGSAGVAPMVEEISRQHVIGNELDSLNKVMKPVTILAATQPNNTFLQQNLATFNERLIDANAISTLNSVRSLEDIAYTKSALIKINESIGGSDLDVTKSRQNPVNTAWQLYNKQREQ